MEQASQCITFDKGITSIVKGVAIIFMIMLHGYTQELYDDATLDFDNRFIVSTYILKICVGMYTFMVGYGYSFSKSRDWRYGWQHIKRLLLSFWVILFVFTLPACFREVLQTDVITLLYNLVGIDSHFNYFSWFVYFYIFAMLVMPGLSKLIDRRPLPLTLAVVVLAVILAGAVHEIPRLAGWMGLDMPAITEISPLLALFNCLMMTPIMVLGYLFARQRYYERINVSRLPKLLTLILCVVVFVGVFLLKRYLSLPFKLPFQMDFFYAPLIIGAIAVAFNVFEMRPLRVVLAKFGDVSVYMWFFHALFFTLAVRWFYQPAITIFHDINLVVLWTIVLTFISSWLIKRAVDYVTTCFASKSSTQTTMP